MLLAIVNWVMESVTIVSYVMVNNGKPCQPFRAVKGIRQGDPLSHFLFVISMDYLSRLLDELPKNRDFKFYPRCRKNSVTYLLFDNDLLLFFYGDSKGYL